MFLQLLFFVLLHCWKINFKHVCMPHPDQAIGTCIKSSAHDYYLPDPLRKSILHSIVDKACSCDLNAINSWRNGIHLLDRQIAYALELHQHPDGGTNQIFDQRIVKQSDVLRLVLFDQPTDGSPKRCIAYTLISHKATSFHHAFLLNNKPR